MVPLAAYPVFKEKSLFGRRLTGVRISVRPVTGACVADRGT